MLVYSAGQRSAFLPCAQGVASYLNKNGGKATALESKGSIENLQLLNETAGQNPKRLATIFLGSAFEAINGSCAWTVGVGPAGGPAESFFKGLIEASNLKVETITGTPAALANDVISGKIDALWQGAALPIPPIKQVADSIDAVVFGLSENNPQTIASSAAPTKTSNAAMNTVVPFHAGALRFYRQQGFKNLETLFQYPSPK